MSETKEKIIKNIKGNPEQCANAFIKLQGEFFNLEQQLQASQVENERMREALGRIVNNSCSLAADFNKWPSTIAKQALTPKE